MNVVQSSRKKRLIFIATFLFGFSFLYSGSLPWTPVIGGTAAYGKVTSKQVNSKGITPVSLPPSALAAPSGFADVVAPLLPAVVNITSTSKIKHTSKGVASPLPGLPKEHPLSDLFRQFFEDRERQAGAAPGGGFLPAPTAFGTGFIIDPSGYIVTNNHILEGGNEITVTLGDEEKTELKGALVGRDPLTDIALIKVEAPQPLPYLKWGDADRVRVGDWAIVVGSPFRLSHTVTVGIISTIARDINLSEGIGPSPFGGGSQGKTSSISGYIQTDAPINVGSSGGPLFNTKGEVVGINTAILSPSGGNIGIGFSIRADDAQFIVEQLKEHGRILPRWIGIQVQRVTKGIASSLGLKGAAKGALVGSVVPGGPASKAGLKERDIILTFGGVPVRRFSDVPNRVRGTPIGRDTELVVWRNGKRKQLTLRVESLPEGKTLSGVFGVPESKSQEEIQPSTPDLGKEVLGIYLRSLNPQEKELLKADGFEKALVISKLKPGSEALNEGLQGGDFILKVEAEEVSTIAELQAILKKARASKKNHVLLLVKRENSLRYFALPL